MIHDHYKSVIMCLYAFSRSFDDHIKYIYKFIEFLSNTLSAKAVDLYKNT